MAELQQRERLQPALLDRLTDDYPQKRKAKLAAAQRLATEDNRPVGQKNAEATQAGQAGSGDSNTGLAADSNQQPAAAPVIAPSPTAQLSGNADRFLISARKLRDIVKRDLSWLMNTGNLEAVQNLDEYPLVKESVINYGVPDMTGVGVDNIDTGELERRLHRILVRFEPRILRKTLKVTVAKSQEMSRNALSFHIECDIWGQPAPEHIQLNSELDLELGSFKFTEAALG